MSDRKNRKRLPQDYDEELLARVRRTETRMTQLMIALGVGTHAQKPRFVPDLNRVELPSPHASLREITDAIPEGWAAPVDVYVGDELLAVVGVSET